jgi:hypothetical protein
MGSSTIAHRAANLPECAIFVRHICANYARHRHLCDATVNLSNSGAEDGSRSREDIFDCIQRESAANAWPDKGDLPATTADGAVKRQSEQSAIPLASGYSRRQIEERMSSAPGNAS